MYCVCAVLDICAAGSVLCIGTVCVLCRADRYASGDTAEAEEQYDQLQEADGACLHTFECIQCSGCALRTRTGKG